MLNRVRGYLCELWALSVGIMPHFEKKKVEGVNFLLAFMNIIKQRHSMPLEKMDSFLQFSLRT